MKAKYLVQLNLYRHYWLAFLVLGILNLVTLLFIAQHWVISADVSSLNFLGSSWWLQSFAITMLVNLQAGQRSLWSQLWSTPVKRLNAVVATFIGFAFLTQLLPLLLWLVMQGTHTLFLDVVGFFWAWLISLSAILVALHCSEFRSYSAAFIVIANLGALAWTAVPLPWQLLLPTLLFAFTLSSFAPSKLAFQYSTLMLKFVGIVIVSWVCLSVIASLLIDDDNRSHSSYTTLQSTPAYQAQAVSQQTWASQIASNLSAIPTQQDTSSQSSVAILVGHHWQPTQSIAPSKSLFFSDHDIKTDWISRRTKNPKIDSKSAEQSPNPYAFFMKQAELVWQTQETTTPRFINFKSDEYALTDNSVLRFHNNQVSVVWRGNDSLTWFAMSEVSQREFLAFGNETTMNLLTLANNSIVLTEFRTQQTPVHLSLNPSDVGFSFIDIDYGSQRGERVSWLAQNRERQLKTSAEFIVEANTTTNNDSRIIVASFLCSLIWLLLARLQRKRRFIAPITP